MDKKKIIFIIIIFIILIILFYVFMDKDSGHKVIMNDYDFFYDNKQRLIGNEEFKESLYGGRYSLSFWLKTSNIPRNASWDSTTETYKTIIYKEGSPNVLFVFPNTIRIEIGYKDDEGSLDYYNFDFELYESQMWNNFIIVIDNRKVEVFKNKLLVMTKVIDNVPWISKKMMSIGRKKENFFGYLGYIDYYNYSLSRNQVIELHDKRKRDLPKYLMNYKQYLEKDKNQSSNILNLINK
jgi:hypothetical protein